MKIIKKKIWPEYFNLIKSGKKQVEIRLADFDVEEGDILILEEYNPKTKQYTGRTIKKRINFLMKTKDMEKMHSKEETEKYGFYILQMEDTE